MIQLCSANLYLVGESLPADGDTSQHTVALILVHHKAGFNAAWLLVGVRHHAADEVWLGLVVDIN